MAPRKSLAAELADLVTSVPTAEVDVLDELEQRPELLESDEELFADLAEAPKRGKEKGLRLRAGIDLDQEDVRYMGRRTTRAAAFKDDLAGADEEGDEDEAGDGSDDDSREWRGASMAGGEEEASGEGYETRGGVDGSDGGHGDMTELGSASSLQDEEEEEEGQERGRGDEDEMAAEAVAAAPSLAEKELWPVEVPQVQPEGGEEGEDVLQWQAGWKGFASCEVSAGGDGEMEALERGFAELRAAEAAAQKEVQDRRERDLAKGVAVQNQQSIWAKVLGMRILLQKALLASHSLPGPEGHDRAVQRPDLARGFSDLKRAASSVLDALLDLGSTLVQQNPAIQTAATAAAAAAEREAEAEPVLRKRDRSSFDSDSSFLWHRLEQADKQWTDFRDTAVDRWQRKASLQSGAAVLQGMGLRALNQGISVQVRDLMSQPERAMQKSQLLLSDRPRQLCNGLPDREEDGAPESSPEALPEQRDPEAFDDADFYQLLLKQFLEGGSDAAPDTMAALRASKKKKSVDRRASKGRKIRYQVHEKLANFMVPVEQEVPLFAARLFSNFASTGDLEVAV